MFLRFPTSTHIPSGRLRYATRLRKGHRRSLERWIPAGRLGPKRSSTQALSVRTSSLRLSEARSAVRPRLIRPRHGLAVGLGGRGRAIPSQRLATVEAGPLARIVSGTNPSRAAPAHRSRRESSARLEGVTSALKSASHRSRICSRAAGIGVSEFCSFSSAETSRSPVRTLVSAGSRRLSNTAPRPTASRPTSTVPCFKRNQKRGWRTWMAGNCSL